jgi:hypothetical protein
MVSTHGSKARAGCVVAGSEGRVPALRASAGFVACTGACVCGRTCLLSGFIERCWMSGTGAGMRILPLDSARVLNVDDDLLSQRFKTFSLHFGILRP